MAFDDFVKGFVPTKKEPPAIIGETFSLGNTLINVDYLPMLQKEPELAKFLEGEKQMSLFKRGWRFQFGTSRSWAGLCDPRPDSVLKSKNKNILVSINFVKGDDNWVDNSKDVVMHEIAHAIVTELFYFGSNFTYPQLKEIDPKHFSHEGHGLIWELVCKAINEGGVCSQFYLNAKTNNLFKPYRYFCVNCQHKGYGNSKTFAVKCEKCLKPVMIEGNN